MAVCAAPSGDGGHVGGRGVRAIVSAEDGIRSVRSVEARLDVLRRDGPSGAWLVTADASTPIGPQTLEERPREVDFAGRAEGRGNPGAIGEWQHIRQEGVFSRCTRSTDDE